MKSRHNINNDTGDTVLLLSEDDLLDSELLQTELLDETPAASSGWLSSLKNTISAVGHGIVAGIKHLAGHPFASIFGFLNAAPSALYALTAPSGASPDKIGQSWWTSMSIFKRVYSIACGGSSLAINGIMNAKFLVYTPKKLKDTLSRTFHSPSDFAVSSVSLVLSVSSATGAAMLSYNSFTWLPYGTYTASVMGVGAGLILAITRYPSVVDILKKPSKLFKKNLRLQRNLADKLEHISARHLAQVETDLNNIIAELRDLHGDINPKTNQHAYENLLNRLTVRLSELSELHPDLIRATTTSEYAKQYAGIVFDTTIALTLFAAPTYVTYSQNGYDAVNLITKFSSGKTLDEMNCLLKILVGLPCGLASAMFYGNSGLGLRETTVAVVTELYNHPKKIPAYLLLCATNGLASGSMFNVARDVVAKENIFALTNNALGSTYLIAQGIGGAGVNTIITSREALLGHSEDTDPTLTLPGIIAQLKLDDAILSDKSVGKISQLGLWSHNNNATVNDTPVQEARDNDQETFIFI